MELKLNDVYSQVTYNPVRETGLSIVGYILFVLLSADTDAYERLCPLSLCSAGQAAMSSWRASGSEF